MKQLKDARKQSTGHASAASEKATRNKMVTIRISDEEYEILQMATRSRGYRNISELARAAMRTLADEHLAPHQVLARRVEEQALRLAAISRDVDLIIAHTPGLQLSKAKV